MTVSLHLPSAKYTELKGMKLKSGMIQGVQPSAEHSHRVERQVTAVLVNTLLKCCVSSIRNNIIVLFRMMHLLCARKYCSATMRHVTLQQQ